MSVYKRGLGAGRLWAIVQASAASACEPYNLRAARLVRFQHEQHCVFG
jgi:hypothetical protein